MFWKAVKHCFFIPDRSCSMIMEPWNGLSWTLKLTGAPSTEQAAQSPSSPNTALHPKIPQFTSFLRCSFSFLKPSIKGPKGTEAPGAQSLLLPQTGSIISTWIIPPSKKSTLKTPKLMLQPFVCENHSCSALSPARSQAAESLAKCNSSD